MAGESIPGHLVLSTQQFCDSLLLCNCLFPSTTLYTRLVCFHARQVPSYIRVFLNAVAWANRTAYVVNSACDRGCMCRVSQKYWKRRVVCLPCHSYNRVSSAQHACTLSTHPNTSCSAVPLMIS